MVLFGKNPALVFSFCQPRLQIEEFVTPISSLVDVTAQMS